MPEVKLGRKKRDPIRGLILEYKAIYDLSIEDLADKWGVSKATCSKRLNTHSDEWLGEAKDLCCKLHIPIESFREAVRY